MSLGSLHEQRSRSVHPRVRTTSHGAVIRLSLLLMRRACDQSRKFSVLWEELCEIYRLEDEEL